MLNDNDREFLNLIAQGLTKKEIARVMGIKVYGVNNRAIRVYQLLGVNNAPSAVAKSIALGIIENPFITVSERRAA